MWIDQCVPTVLNYSGSVVNYVSTGTFYQIQALGNGATVKALTSAGTVYGTTDVYSTSTGITMLPGERWEGKFISVALYGGDVVLHELPGGNEEIVSYGAGTAYATVNDLPDYVADRKLTIVDRSTGIKTACCWVFHNEGVDYVNCGRPSSLINLLNPLNDYYVKVVARLNSFIAWNAFVSLGAAVSTPIQMQIASGNSVGNGFSSVGGSGLTGSLGITLGEFYKFTLRNFEGMQTLGNGNAYSSGPAGESVNNSAPIIIGASLSVNNNVEATIAHVSFYDGAETLVDCYDFTDKTKWSGGSTMVSCAGNTATFTDGTPTGIRKKAAIPRNLLVY